MMAVLLKTLVYLILLTTLRILYAQFQQLLQQMMLYSFQQMHLVCFLLYQFLHRSRQSIISFQDLQQSLQVQRRNGFRRGRIAPHPACIGKRAQGTAIAGGDDGGGVAGFGER